MTVNNSSFFSLYIALFECIYLQLNERKNTPFYQKISNEHFIGDYCLCAKRVQNIFFFKTYQFLVLLRKIRYVLIADKGSERNPDIK